MSNTRNNRWLAMLFICISLLVISLDNTILNVALPSISSELGASSSDLQWIVDSYVLVFAALLLTMGALGDRYGRKRALQFGLVWFGIGSLGAALSTSTEMLIAARAFLGIGGAIIMPATLSIVTATFREPKERSQAIGIWAATFGLGIGLGPVIGGWLIDNYSWNSVFFVNLPVMALAIIGGYFFIQESRDEEAPPADIPGVLLSITGLFALVYGIIEAGIVGWTADNVLLAFGSAIVLLGAFAWWENRNPNAMLPLHFFRNRAFTGANLALVMAMFGMFGSMFFLSQYLQSVQGYGPLDAGLRIFPLALVVMVSSAMSARVSALLGIRRTVTLGMFIAAIGLLMFAQFAEVDSEYGIILLSMATVGLGLGTAMPPATDSVMASVPVNKAGIGSAMNDTTRELGGALGVAVLGTILNDVYLTRIRELEAAPIMAMLPDEPKAIIESSIQGAHVVANQLNAGQLSDLIRNTASEAFVAGMGEAMIIGGIILSLAAVVAYVILPATAHRSQEEDAAETPSIMLPEVAPSAFGD